jgi:ribosomal-protein-alanine N-acetyltransferase
MALFRFSGTADDTPVLRTTGMVLRPPRMDDFEAWAHLRELSRAFYRPGSRSGRRMISPARPSGGG